MSEKEKILSLSFEVFLSEGINRTTVDTLAGKIGYGKNKIYNYFPTKQVLLEESIKYFINNIKNKVRETLKTRESAVVKLIRMFSLISAHVMRFDEKFLNDLRFHNHDIWITIDRVRKKIAYETISELIKQGKKEKIFIDYPEEILTTIFIGSFRAVINPEFLLHNNYSMKEAFNYTNHILINAILSEKGKSLLKKLNLPQ